MAKKNIENPLNYPKVSVIILNRNGVDLLKVSVPSLVRTRYPNFELILVDNGSSDESVSFLKNNYPNVRIISLNVNKGVAAANNIGALAAQGELLAFVNNDVEVDPNWLLPLVLALENNPSAAGCDSKYLNYFERNKFDGNCGAGRFIDKFGNAYNRGVGEVDKGQFDDLEEVFHGNSLFRKSLFIKIGGFDESFFAYYEETDLCWRVHRFGYKYLYVPQSIIYHMGSGTSSVSGFNGKLKKPIALHYYKNRLRMIIKNQFGISLFFSLSGYLLDFGGTVLTLLFLGDQSYIPVLVNAIFWNLTNLKGTLQERIKFKNESADFQKLYLPYSGVWRLCILKSIQKIVSPKAKSKMQKKLP